MTVLAVVIVGREGFRGRGTAGAASLASDEMEADDEGDESH